MVADEHVVENEQVVANAAEAAAVSETLDLAVAFVVLNGPGVRFPKEVRQPVSTRAIVARRPDVAADLWRRHEPELRELATSRGLQPRYHSRFYGEWQAHRAREQAEEKRVAIHEAGHAVAAVSMGRPMARVQLAGNGAQAWGYALGAYDVSHKDVVWYFETYEPDGVPHSEPTLSKGDNLSKEIITLLAGGHALAQHDRSEYCLYRTYAWHDVWMAQHYLGRALHVPAHSDRVMRHLRIFHAASAGLVKRERRWIAAVASALVRHRSLTGEQVAHLRPRRTPAAPRVVGPVIGKVKVPA